MLKASLLLTNQYNSCLVKNYDNYPFGNSEPIASDQKI
jgi:hypothetical protein